MKNFTHIDEDGDGFHFRFRRDYVKVSPISSMFSFLGPSEIEELRNALTEWLETPEGDR